MSPDAAGVHLIDRLATPHLPGLRYLITVIRERVPKLAYEWLGHTAMPRDHPIAPLLPFLVLQQDQHRPAFVSIRAPEPVHLVGAGGVELGRARSALAHLSSDGREPDLLGGVNPVETVADVEPFVPIEE
jgi:hypothetical protein